MSEEIRNALKPLELKAGSSYIIFYGPSSGLTRETIRECYRTTLAPDGTMQSAMIHFIPTLDISAMRVFELSAKEPV